MLPWAHWRGVLLRRHASHSTEAGTGQASDFGGLVGEIRTEREEQAVSPGPLLRRNCHGHCMGRQVREGSGPQNGPEWGNETKAIRVARSSGPNTSRLGGSNRYEKAMREGTITELSTRRDFENKARPLVVDSTFPESTGQFIHIRARRKPRVTIREQTCAQEDNKTKGTESIIGGIRFGERNRRGG